MTLEVGVMSRGPMGEWANGKMVKMLSMGMSSGQRRVFTLAVVIADATRLLPQSALIDCVSFSPKSSFSSPIYIGGYVSSCLRRYQSALQPQQ
jgi:hypothetical protein